MNFAAAVGALRELARANGESVAIKVEVWLGDEHGDRLEWNVWSSNRHAHYYGRTAEAVIAAYVNDIRAGMEPATPEVIASVDAVDACECGRAVIGETHACTALPRMDSPEMIDFGLPVPPGSTPEREAELNRAIRARGLRR